MLLAGRVNSVKMIIMPMLELDKSISTLNWSKTIPWIRRAHLEKQKEAGGLSLPNLLQFYQADNIFEVIYWVSVSYEGGGPVWVEMEWHSTHPVSLPSLVCAPLPLSKQHLTSNLIVSGSLRIWSQFRTHFKHRQAMPYLTILANTLFPPSLKDTALCYGSEMVCNGWRTFLRMVCSCHFAAGKWYNIPSSHYFRYLQVHVFVRNIYIIIIWGYPDDCLTVT